MALATWSKNTIKNIYTPSAPYTTETINIGRDYIQTPNGYYNITYPIYEDYNINANNLPSGVNEIYYAVEGNIHLGSDYIIKNNSVYRIDYITYPQPPPFQDSNCYIHCTIIYKALSNITIGTYISDVTAEQGTYPSNGANGGYWYVLKNSAPSAPTSVICQTKSFAKNAIVVTWINSTDIQNDTIIYNIDFFNGTTWISSIGNTTSTSFSYTLPDIQTKNAKFRVRSYDSKLYSEYTESNTFEIQRIQMFINIDSQERRYFEGYVKIDGVLKKITDVWTKVDGVLKKV